MIKKKVLGIFLALTLAMTPIILLIPEGSVYAAIGTELYYDDGEMDSSMQMFGSNGFVAVRFTPPSVPVEITQLSFYSEFQSPETTVGARVLIFNNSKVVIYVGSLFTNWNVGWNYLDLSQEDIQITEGDFYAGIEILESGMISFGLDEDPVIDQRSYFGYERYTENLDYPIGDFDYMIRATVVPFDFGLENDNFPGTIISGESGSISASNVDATLETDEPYHGFGWGAHTVWWSWTAPRDGTAVFDTYGSIASVEGSLDTILAVYTGDNLNELTIVALNDDFDEEGSYRSQLAFKAVEGTTYKIVADGYNYDVIGTINLNWSYVTPEVGDDFSGTIITGLNGQDIKSNVYATKEFYEPLHALNPDYEGQSSLWWTWTAPETGRFIFDTKGSTPYFYYDIENLKTIMSIYTGDSLSELVRVGYSDYSPGSAAVVTIEATKDTTYRIAVDGQSSYYDAIGNIVLNWYQVVAPIITSADHVTFKVGTESSFKITATGIPEPTVALSIYSLPDGVFFDDASDTLGGTPVAGTGGSYPLHFYASNGIDPIATQDFTLIVSQPPNITSADQSTFKVGEEGSFTVNVTGYPKPSVSITSGVLPDGVIFDSESNRLYGVATEGTGGSYPITFTASNGVDPDATQSFSLNVINEMAPIIKIQPKDTTVLAGETATFTVEYNAYPEPWFQWQSSRDGKRWSNIDGATLVSYTTSVTRINMDGFQYRVLLSNGIGEQAVSNAAILTVISGPMPVTVDVSIDKQDGIYNTENGNIAWVITITNNGENPADNVIVKDTLAKGTKFVAIDLSGVGSATYKVKGTAVDVDLGQLPGNSSVNFTITSAVGRVTSPVGNIATVTTTSMDSNLENNTDSATCSW